MAVSKPVTEQQVKNALLPLSAEVANMRDEQIRMLAKVEKNTKYLFGNGEAGLDERVRNIETQINKQNKIFSTLALGVGGWVLVEVVKILLGHF